ncbi:hypothetical protein DV736_g5783, partial [Chaetothyriales sp. CBS 134916]
MASPSVDRDTHTHQANNALLDPQSPFSAEPLDFGPCSKVGVLFASSSTPLETVHWTNSPNSFGHMRSEYTPLRPEQDTELSGLYTDLQDSTSSAEFRDTYYPSLDAVDVDNKFPNAESAAIAELTAGAVDLAHKPTDAEPAHPVQAPPEVIDLSQDDDDTDQVIESPFQDCKQVVINEESQETDQVLRAGTEPLSSNALPSAKQPKDCQRVLEEFMANVQRRSNLRSDRASLQPEDVDMDDLLVDSDEENEKAIARFSELKAAFEIQKEAGAVSLQDQVDFNRVENAERNRLQLRQDAQEYVYCLNEEQSLFFPEPQSLASPTVPVPDMQRPDKSTAAYMPVEYDLHQSSEPISQPSERPGGSVHTRGRAGGRGRADSNHTKVSQGKVTKSRGDGTRKARGGRKARQNRNTFEMHSLLPYDMSSQIQRNLKEPAQPQFTSKNKTEALSQLIALIPKPQRDLHVQDKGDLLKATKEFKRQRSMKSDGDGRWLLSGMNTHLHHYQVIGCARMRDNERQISRAGGILADDMGLGKTVMALANIIDGRPDNPGDTPKATLIVTPASLTGQWYAEIFKHTDMARFPQRVMVYRSSSSAYSSSPEFFLSLHDIVITSYNELNKSMPNNNPPPNLVTDDAKREWFEDYFKKNKGALHRVKWLRIVLDEAHAIKNHESKTSNSVYKLQAKYRWALSGTPVQNSLTEFFAYFRFLRVKYTGDFGLFKKNYCKRGSEKALLRLRARLEAFVIRRTHQDTMFGRPIIQLPPIENRTVELEFSLVEKTMYDIVRRRFKTKVKDLQRTLGSYQRCSTFIYVLLLRLRQLTAHILLIEKTLSELLEAQDFVRLWNLIGLGQQLELHDNERELLRGLEMALSIRNKVRCQRESQDTDIDATPPPPQSRSQQNYDFSRQFRECLAAMRQDGLWEMANQHSLCHLCHHPPKHPHLTSCCHVYCFACLNELGYRATGSGDATGICAECDEKFDKTEALAATDSDETQTQDGELISSARYSEEFFDWYKHRPVPRSTKLGAAVKQMEIWFAKGDEKGNENKVLVFSQFRGVIKAFSTVCSENQWNHQVFHGEMSIEARNRAIETFTTDRTCKVLLAGMKSGGVGLNLTAANKVILVDLWWNVAVETQAFCRVYRIGQERPCEVVRFAIKSTIDTEIILMQERKTREIESALTWGGSMRGLTTAELLKLFGNDDEGGGGDETFILPDDPYDGLDDES